jgi:hypothetical protein
MKKKQLVLGVLIFGIVCSGIGYFMAPEEIREVEKIVTVEKIVRVEVEKKAVDRNIEKETTITESPDGTRHTIIKETDKSVEVVETDIRETEDSSVVTNKERILTKGKKDWFATTLVGISRDGIDFSLNRSHLTVLLQHRLIGGIYTGVWVTLNGDFGVGLSLMF